MSNLAPFLVALSIAALPVPLAVKSALAVIRRRAELEESFIATAVTLGMRAEGKAGARRCRLEHEGCEYIAESWSYNAPAPEGGTVSKAATRLRRVERVHCQDMMVLSKKALINPPARTLQLGAPSPWQEFEVFAVSEAPLSAWLESSPSPISAGLPGLLCLDVADGRSTLLYDGGLHDAAMLPALAEALAAFAAGRTLAPRSPVNVAMPPSSTGLLGATFAALVISVTVATPLATWPGIPSFFEPLFCQPRATLMTYWVSGEEPGTSHYIMECVHHGSRTSTSSFGDFVYHLMAFGVIVSMILVVFLVVWHRTMGVVHNEPLRRVAAARRGPYRDASSQ